MFFYHEKPHLPTQGHLKDHVVWSGDVMKKDASITLQQVSPTFNGTYTCQVRNMPDAHGRDGEVVVRVINDTASRLFFVSNDTSTITQPGWSRLSS